MDIIGIYKKIGLTLKFVLGQYHLIWRCYMIDKIDKTKLSKTMSYILRHSQ